MCGVFIPAYHLGRAGNQNPNDHRCQKAVHSPQFLLYHTARSGGWTSVPFDAVPDQKSWELTSNGLNFGHHPYFCPILHADNLKLSMINFYHWLSILIPPNFGVIKLTSL